MKRNILIIFAIILALALIGELVFVVYQRGAENNNLPGNYTTDTTGKPGAGTGVSQDATENDETRVSPEATLDGENEDSDPVKTTNPEENTDPGQSTKPGETTKPAGTEPEETTEGDQDGGLDENDLPLQRL